MSTPRKIVNQRMFPQPLSKTMLAMVALTLALITSPSLFAVNQTTGAELLFADESISLWKL